MESFCGLRLSVDGSFYTSQPRHQEDEQVRGGEGEEEGELCESVCGQSELHCDDSSEFKVFHQTQFFL